MKDVHDDKIAITLKDLMRFQHMVFSGRLFPNKRVFSVLSGRHVSKLRGRGLDFEEVRLYVLGDDIRNIDWKVTARTKKTHTKVFTEEKERPALVVIDQSSKMFFGTQLYMKSVIAAEIAALAVFRALKSGDRVGALVFDDEKIERVAPQRSLSNAQRIMRVISDKNQALKKIKKVNSNVEQLNEALRRLASVSGHDYVISVISDFTEADEETFKHLIQLSRHNNVIVIHVSDPMEQQLPNEKVLISDGEEQLNWEGKKEKYYTAFTDKALKFQENLYDRLRKFGIVVSFFSTDDSTLNQVKRTMEKAN